MVIDIRYMTAYVSHVLHKTISVIIKQRRENRTTMFSQQQDTVDLCHSKQRRENCSEAATKPWCAFHQEIYNEKIYRHKLRSDGRILSTGTKTKVTPH